MNHRIKAFSLILAVVLTALCCPAVSAAADGAPVSFTVATKTSLLADEAITVPITAERLPEGGINGFQFRVTYDQTVLSYQSAEIFCEGEYRTINPQDGTVEFLWTDLDAFTGDGPVAEITFSPLAAGFGAVQLTFDSSAGDSVYYIGQNNALIDLPYTVRNGGASVLTDVESAFRFEAEAPDAPIDGPAAVTLTVKNAENIYGFSLEVDFDPEKLSFDEGTLSGAFPYGRIVENTPGRVRVFASTEINAPVTGDAALATLLFDVIDPERAEGSSYEIALTFYNGQPAYTMDANGRAEDILCAGAFGTTVTLTGADPYDLDRSGSCTISDVTLLLDCLSGGATLPAGVSGDLDHSGSVSINDVTALLDHLSGAGS